MIMTPEQLVHQVIEGLSAKAVLDTIQEGMDALSWRKKLRKSAPKLTSWLTDEGLLQDFAADLAEDPSKTAKLAKDYKIPKELLGELEALT
jgi:hypothetical protein